MRDRLTTGDRLLKWGIKVMFNASFVIKWRLEIIYFLNVALVPEFGISVWQDVGLIFLWSFQRKNLFRRQLVKTHRLFG
jgi:hypothetical protein